MRVISQYNGLRCKVYAGTTGVLLAFNTTPEARAGLLGFAIKRGKVLSGESEWLTGMLPFPGQAHLPGALLPTNIAPIQRFRWGDWRVYPDTAYRYKLYAVYGTPDAPDLKLGPTIEVRTAPADSGVHRVLFNRAAAASQAFSRRFAQDEANLNAALAAREAERVGAGRARTRLPGLSPEALAWLTRGLLEQITGFIEAASGPTFALDIAIYEYQLPAIVDAVRAAFDRGVRVRIVYHAKPGDPQTDENEEALHGLPEGIATARVTSKICHHKFMIRSRVAADGTKTPEELLCGSTNFTLNGVYRQANVVHITTAPNLLKAYCDLWEQLGARLSPKDTATWITTNNPVSAATVMDLPSGWAGFSPRRGGGDLEAFAHLINKATRDVLFCTAFKLNSVVEEALLGKPNDAILRYGLQNTASASITGVHADRTADFVAAAFLKRGLEGFLQESTRGQRGNILIHTKLVVVDFTSDQPVIISGSHNLSKNGSEGNDENYLILRGDTDVADMYGCELMRLYDHYRFRFHVNQAAERDKDVAMAKVPRLCPTDAWTTPYFEEGDLRFADRVCFAGKME